MVRSCPFLQDTVRTKSTDIGIRHHRPEITARDVWKMKMHGKIRLTSLQLSEQQACSLSLQWSVTGSKEIQVIYPIQNQMLLSRGPQPWLLVFAQVSIPLTSQDCYMQCKLHPWDHVQNVPLFLPLIQLPLLRLFASTLISGIYVISLAGLYLGWRGWIPQGKPPVFTI